MTRQNSESGFALLFIYAMAATVAIMLYMELPRAAFEAQRDKEQLLIDRGEQYSRAITLYVRKFNRYPPDFDALDNTQNLRFLRGHYADPITGKNEWRLIHVGPGGVFLDSLVNTKKKDDTQSAPQNFITEVQQTGGNQVDPAQGVNLATRVRPSDQPGAAGDPNNPQPSLPPPDFGLAQPGQLQPGQLQPGQIQPGQLQPGLPQPGFPQPGLPQPGFPQPGLSQPGLPQGDPNGQIINNPFPALNGQAVNGQQPFGQPPNGQLPNGQQPQTQNPTTAANLINQLLTNPRPGGLNGLNGQQPTIDQYGNPVPPNPLTATTAPAPAPAPPPAPVAAAAPTIGGGIAGVASKREQEGIKIYNTKKKYNEWEFVYDITKDKTRSAGAIPQTAPATPAAQQTPQQPAAATPPPQLQQMMPTGAMPIPGTPMPGMPVMPTPTSQ